MQHLFLHALNRLIYSIIYDSFFAVPFFTSNLVRYGWSRRSKGDTAQRFPFFSAGFFIWPIPIG